MIEIHLLKELLIFHETGTLSSAAEKLHISQPALSRSMQKLEMLSGVPIFERKRNKLSLNENGILLAEYARKILDMQNEMLKHVQAFDKNNRILSWAACSRTPLKMISEIIEKTLPEKESLSELDKEVSMIQKLDKDLYSFIVLTHPLEGTEYFCKLWKNEHLYVTLPSTHPLAEKYGIYLKELDGSNILLYSQIGFWLDLYKQKMPNTHIIMHDEYEILNHLRRSVNWPIFQSNFSILDIPPLENRVRIPILDPEASVTYYCICKKKNYSRLKPLFEAL